jgi:hypothetical protein
VEVLKRVWMVVVARTIGVAKLIRSSSSPRGERVRVSGNERRKQGVKRSFEEKEAEEVSIS